MAWPDRNWRSSSFCSVQTCVSRCTTGRFSASGFELSPRRNEPHLAQKRSPSSRPDWQIGQAFPTRTSVSRSCITEFDAPRHRGVTRLRALAAVYDLARDDRLADGDDLAQGALARQGAALRRLLPGEGERERSLRPGTQEPLGGDAGGDERGAAHNDRGRLLPERGQRVGIALDGQAGGGLLESTDVAESIFEGTV